MNRKLGKYEIKERLGRGGMAEVYRAYHVNLDRHVAIKVLHRFLADDPEFKSRFEREAQNIARLRHAHIVQVYDFDFEPEDGSYYMVMELVEGYTLKERLSELDSTGQMISLEEALRIIRESAMALSYAHRAGMIHRDVKPANLMLDQTENDRVVLTDFGIAKIVTGAQFTMTGGLIGTPAYMSPEQGVGESGDERSDLYSLGVILYQMVTGELPYDADTPLALILKHVNEAIPSASVSRPSIPSQVDDLIEKLMAKDLDIRYQTATEVIEDIQQLETDLAEGNLPSSTEIPPLPIVMPIKSVAGSSNSAVDRPTVRFKDYDTPDSLESLVAKMKTVEPEEEQSGGRWMLLLLAILVGGIIIAGGYFVGANNGVFPALAFFASETPAPTITTTSTPTATVTTTPTNTATLTATQTPTLTATNTSTVTATPTPTSTSTASTTPTVTTVPTDTPIPIATNTSAPAEPPSVTPNMTQTLSIERTATIAACTFDYGIISQEPEDGEEGGFVETNTDYERVITLLNTGTCEWERNTSLTFVEGEDFDAGPRIFIREPVAIGAEVAVTFEGTTPNRGAVEGGEVVPLEGTWQLRTPGQITIGDPVIIGVLVFDPGN